MLTKSTILIMRAFSAPYFSRKGRVTALSSRVRKIQAATMDSSSSREASAMPKFQKRSISTAVIAAPMRMTRTANRYLPATMPRRLTGVDTA